MAAATRLGHHVHEACAARGLTQAESAAALGISRVYLTHLISGRRRPSLGLLEQLAAWLRVPVGELLGPTADPEQSYLARHTAPAVVRQRALAASLARWRQAAEDRGLQAENELEAARLDGEARAYRRVAAALRLELVDAPEKAEDLLNEARDRGCASSLVEPGAWRPSV
jgi:transcriptional regulator with XRE-family HTH domain